MARTAWRTARRAVLGRIRGPWRLGRSVVGALKSESKVRADAARANRELARGAEGDRPVVVGPWISEIGFEVLYWVPMLNWIAKTFKIDRKRMVVLTRGGAHCWYSNIADRGVEIFDHFSPEELREWHDRRVAEAGGQKHMAMTSLDEEILRRVGDEIGTDDYNLVHPLVMYNRFRYLWSWKASPRVVERSSIYKGLKDPGLRSSLPADLPEDYIAFKAYFSSSLPETEENRAFVADLIARLRQRAPVVLLSTGLKVDDHSDVDVASGSDGHPIFDARDWMTPQDNLAVQTSLIAGAQALVSSYGGFSYLGPFLGVPSLCFYSDRNFNSTHLEVMARAVDRLHAQPFAPVQVRDFALIDSLLGAQGPVRAAR